MTLIPLLVLFLFLLCCGLLRVDLCGLLFWSSFLYRVFWPMRATFGHCLHLSRMHCGSSLSVWVFSVCLGFHPLLPPCSSLWLPCRSLGSLAQVPLFVTLSFSFPDGPPHLLFLLDFLVVVSRGQVSSLPLSPVLEIPLALGGSLSSASVESQVPSATESSLWAESVAVGFFAFLLVHLSFAHLSTFLYVCILLLLYRSFSSLRSLISVYYRPWGVYFLLRLVVRAVSAVSPFAASLAGFFLRLPPALSFLLPLLPVVPLVFFSFWWPFPPSLSVLALAFLGVSLPIGLVRFRSSLFVTSSAPVGVSFRAYSSSWPLSDMSLRSCCSPPS